jgi:hypothetical protein
MVEFDHVAFMKDQDKWPTWPRLPIKRKRSEGWPELGLLIGGAGPNVYLANLFEKAIDTTKVIEYDSYEDLFNEGWRVD